MSGEFDRPTDSQDWGRLRRRWQEIDRLLNVGEFSPEDTVEAILDAGLARRAIGPGRPHPIREACIFEPERYSLLVPGPLLLVVFTDGGHGGPAIYRPVSDELRWDTGAFS
jgi:hypothetical protein